MRGLVMVRIGTAFTTDSVLTTPDAWNHVATTFDGTTYRVYINGQSVFSTTNFEGRTPINTQRVRHWSGG